jgi:hypothetical protein
MALSQILDAGQWRYFMGQRIRNMIVEVDQTGAWVQDIVPVSIPSGMALYPPQGAPSPLSGHMFVTDSLSNIWDVDLQTKTKVAFVPSAGSGADGLSFSPSGATLYVAFVVDNVIRAYDSSNGNLTWTSPVIPGGPDGIAAGLGTLSGYLYCNFINGEVWEIGSPGGPHDGQLNKLAEGGSRGDFIAVDPNVYSGGAFPSLLLTQTDRIMRLDPPGGGWIGPPTSSAIRVADELGNRYCAAKATSTGTTADLYAIGQLSTSAGALTLESTPVPNRAGIFFHGAGPAEAHFGNGFRCVAGGLVRGTLVLPGGNLASYTYDNSTPSHSLLAYAGSTRYFQYWFRDPMGGGAAFNLSTAMSLALVP